MVNDQGFGFYHRTYSKYGALWVVTSAFLVITAFITTRPSLGFYDRLAIVFCTIWIVANAYFFYPVVRESLKSRDFSDRHDYIRTADAAAPNPDTGTTPATIDVLLPAYRESTVINRAIRHLRKAEPSAELVSINVLLEEHDEETRSALEAIEGELEFTIIEVPNEYPNQPRKPRALNYGFELTDGDIVGIIDAEDIVDPTLFDKVRTAIDARGYDYCQGILDMSNESVGWMNTLFRGEYGYWFRYLLPRYHAADFPVPLGGTTNFFRRSVLEDISEYRKREFGEPWDEETEQWLGDHGLVGVIPWDPRNVTEDFELGILLWIQGYKRALIEVTTTEFSPFKFDTWLRQRTRWQKGKIYTLLYHLRNPPTRLADKAHLFGQSALPHMGAINIIGVLLLLVLPNLIWDYQLHPSVYPFMIGAATFMVIAALLQAKGYSLATDQDTPIRQIRILANVVTLPVYWLMQWLADLRAMKQIYISQLHWEKTPHYAIDTELDEIFGSSGFVPERVSSWVRTHRRVAMGLGLGGVLLIGGILRSYRLGANSLWVGEIAARRRAAAGPRGLFTGEVHIDVHQASLELTIPFIEGVAPLYYLGVSQWVVTVGDSVGLMRAFSVLLGVATIFVIFMLGRTLFTPSVGMLAALLMAILPFPIQFARTLEPYTLLIFLGALSLLFVVYYVKTDGARWTSVGYVLTAVLFVNAHIIAILGILAQTIFVLHSNKSNQTLRGSLQWAVLLIPVSLATVPQLITYNPGSYVPQATASIHQPLLVNVGYTPAHPLSIDQTILQGTSLILLGIFFVATALSILDYRTTRDASPVEHLEWNYLLGLWLIVPIIAGFGFIGVEGIGDIARFAGYGSVAFVLLLANGLTKIRNQKLRIGLIAIVVIASLGSTGLLLTADTKEDWQQTGAHLNEHADEEAMIIYSTTEERLIIERYHGEDVQFVKLGDISDEEAYLLLRHGPDQVWIVDSPYQTPHTLQGMVGDTRTLTDEQRFGEIHLQLYEEQ